MEAAIERGAIPQWDEDSIVSAQRQTERHPTAAESRKPDGAIHLKYKEVSGLPGFLKRLADADMSTRVR